MSQTEQPTRSYYLRDKPIEARAMGGVPSGMEDGRYWPMIGGVPFDTRNVEKREELQFLTTYPCEALGETQS